MMGAGSFGMRSEPAPKAELWRSVLAHPSGRRGDGAEGWGARRYFSPQVERKFIALSEHWRNELSVAFSKRSADGRVGSRIGVAMPAAN